MLRGVSLDAAEGEIATLFVGNGAGKTTTLRAACGVLRPSGGRVLADGRDTAGPRAVEVVGLGLRWCPRGGNSSPSRACAGT